MRTWLLLTSAGAWATSTLIVACSGIPQTCAEYRSCESDSGTGDATTPEASVYSGSGDSGQDAGRDGDASGCDKAKSPATDPCVLRDDYGIFVDVGKGADSAAGTKAAPLKKIGDAITKAKAEGKSVFACEGTYPEKLVIDANANGVRVYGGLKCDWTYDVTKRPVVKPTATGNALLVDGASNVEMEDFELESLNAVGRGESSIAVLMKNANDIVFRRIHVRAGNGGDGVDAPPIAAFAAQASVGNDGTLTNGGGRKAETCANGTGNSAGGAAGSPAVGGQSGASGEPLGTANGGNNANTCGGGGSGNIGNHGTGGATGAGAATLGVLSTSGWTPSSGALGGNGVAAQGGGGGASRDATGGGGGGGLGGCGGAGGGGGGGGGASIALLFVQSKASLVNVVLRTGAAGRGGSAATGQTGQTGGLGGNRFGAACVGGEGGNGGSGGGGGGGAGGVSLGIAWTGTAPTIDAQTVQNAATHPAVTLAAKGNKGTKGSGGAAPATGGNGGTDGTDGVDGVAEAVKGF
jgi:hypothetical protein